MMSSSFYKYIIFKYLIFFSTMVLAFTEMVAESPEDFVHIYDSDPTEEIWRGRFFLWMPDAMVPSSAKGVLVLCPGQNVNGSALASNDFWRSFAAENNLAVVGVHFNSPDSELDDGRGYFRAWRGSGQMLEKALQEWNLADKPLLLYGFSGGAYFAHSFAQTTPLKVAAWAALATRKWETAPNPASQWMAIPGLLACGENDSSRFSATFHYFQTGRLSGARWAWYPIPQHGHGYNDHFDAFAAKFLITSLAHPVEGEGTLVDNTTQKTFGELTFNRPPEMHSWLPCESILPFFRSH